MSINRITRRLFNRGPTAYLLTGPGRGPLSEQVGIGPMTWGRPTNVDRQTARRTHIGENITFPKITYAGVISSRNCKYVR